LRKLVENKYGCRVMQALLVRLCKYDGAQQQQQQQMHSQLLQLRKLMETLTNMCSELVLNEYGNYIIQDIVCSTVLGRYRDRIIEGCLL
jgi:hypothetical protein